MLSIALCSVIWLVGVLTQPYLFKLLPTLRKLGFSWPTVGSDDRLHVLEEKTDLPWFDGRSKQILKLFIALHSIFVASGTIISSEGHWGWTTIGLGLVFISLDMGSLWRATRNFNLVLKFAMPVSFLCWPVASLVFEAMGLGRRSKENVADLEFVELVGWSSVAMLLTTLMKATEKQQSILRTVALGLLVGMSLVRMATDVFQRNLWFDMNEIRQLFLVILGLLAWHTLLPMVANYVAAAHASDQLQEMNIRLQATVEDLHKETSSLQKRASHVSVLAHEVRTPLNAVLSACTLLQDTGLNADQAEYVRMINTCLAQISNNVNFVLDMAKMEAGVSKLESQPFSVYQMCAQALSMVWSLAENKGIELRLECSKSIGLVRGDAARLSQALQNLLTNSIKFTHNGSVTLAAFVSHSGFGLIDSPRNMTQVRFEVIDTGIGMSPEEQDKLFQPFVQAQDERTQSQYGGTGLGLVITRKIIQLMGGTVMIDPERTSVGVGSTFVIDIPLPSGSIAGCTNSLIEAPSNTYYSSRTRMPHRPQSVSVAVSQSTPNLSTEDTTLTSSLHLHGGLEQVPGFSPSDDRLANPETPLRPRELTHPTLADLVEAREADFPSSFSEEGEQLPLALSVVPQEHPPSLPKSSQNIEGSSASLPKTPLQRNKSVVMPKVPPSAFDSAVSAMRVLLVEDNVLTGMLMVKILETIGFGHVVHCTDANSALTHLQNDPAIHVIITDLHLPGSMDGLALATSVRSSLKYRSTLPSSVVLPLNPASSSEDLICPVLRLPLIIGLSGDTNEKTPLLCKQVGMDAFLVKPVARERIQDIIARLLGASKPRMGFRGASGASSISRSIVLAHDKMDSI